MGRVERRMYKRREKRRRNLRRGMLLVIALVCGAAVWLRNPPAFKLEMLGTADEGRGASKDAERVETREVTLQEDVWYAIQTGVFSTEDAALQKADAYAQRGAPGTVIREGEKWRVFIACYSSEEEAAAVRTRLEQNQKVDTYLYEWNCPELRLRLTGKTGQLDAVEAGCTLMISTAAGLRDIAVEMDAAQLTLPEVQSALKSMDDQIRLWKETLRSSFGKQMPELALDLLAITGQWEKGYALMQEAEGATSLSAALKAQGMLLYDVIAAWRVAFAQQ